MPNAGLLLTLSFPAFFIARSALAKGAPWGGRDDWVGGATPFTNGRLRPLNGTLRRKAHKLCLCCGFLCGF